MTDALLTILTTPALFYGAVILVIWLATLKPERRFYNEPRRTHETN